MCELSTVKPEPLWDGLSATRRPGQRESNISGTGEQCAPERVGVVGGLEVLPSQRFKLSISLNLLLRSGEAVPLSSRLRLVR